MVEEVEVVAALAALEPVGGVLVGMGADTAVAGEEIVGLVQIDSGASSYRYVAT